MSNNSPAFSQLATTLFSDFRLPGAAMEHRVVTGSSATFSSSLDSNTPYFIQSMDAPCLFTLNGANPTLTDGTGSNQGMPLSAGVAVPFIPGTGQTELRITGLGTGTRVILMTATSGSRI